MKSVPLIAAIVAVIAVSLFLLLPNQGHGGRRPGTPQVDPATATKGTVLIQGGYETDPRDNGRPVSLIAGALGVESQVFRDAFSNVNPSSFGPPSGSRARANKKVLMDALGKYGVTNDRLDEVSDYYRYRGEAGEVWPITPANVEAVIENGKVTGFEVTNGGSGYSSAPNVSVAGYDTVKVRATIEFSTDFQMNGRIASLTIVE